MIPKVQLVPSLSALMSQAPVSPLRKAQTLSCQEAVKVIWTAIQEAYNANRRIQIRASHQELLMRLFQAMHTTEPVDHSQLLIDVVRDVADCWIADEPGVREALIQVRKALISEVR